GGRQDGFASVKLDVDAGQHRPSFVCGGSDYRLLDGLAKVGLRNAHLAPVACYRNGWEVGRIDAPDDDVEVRAVDGQRLSLLVQGQGQRLVRMSADEICQQPRRNGDPTLLLDLSRDHLPD